MEQETFWTLLRDAAHWEFEIFLMVVFDGVVGALLWPFLRKHWKHHVAHDKAFKNRGWFESRDKGVSWKYVAKTEEEVNQQLFDWAEADGVDWFEREEMYAGVEIGGSAIWNRHTGPFPVDPPPESERAP